MLKRQIMLALMGAALVATPALSQTTTSPSSSPAATTAAPVASQHKAGEWRASKLIGLNVYNNANEKIGDINEVILDSSGKIANVILGVGGFLGMGEHNVAVGFDKLKFVNEPVRAATADKDARPAATTRAATTARNEWYPDHATFDATKDQLKAMPQFKY